MTNETQAKTEYHVYYHAKNTDCVKETYCCDTVNECVRIAKAHMDMHHEHTAYIGMGMERVGAMYTPRYHPETVYFRYHPTGETVRLNADGTIPGMGEIRLSASDTLKFAPRTRIDGTSYSIGMSDGRYAISIDNPGAYATFEGDLEEMREFANFILDYIRRH